MPPDTPVALESVGNWYRISDEIEAAGCHPLVTKPARAKLLIGHVNKTDNLDAMSSQISEFEQRIHSLMP